MTGTAKIFVLGILTLHAFVIWSLYRRSMRAEHAARERRRAFRRSLLNRRES